MSSQQKDSPNSPTGFAQKLTLFDATMIVISGIIGGGIFISPVDVAAKTHTPFMILICWVAGGAIALSGAFVFAELSTVFPKVGGQYAYFREAIHPIAGFLHGWTLLLIIQSAATAAIANACSRYVAEFFEWPSNYVVPMATALLFTLAIFHSLGVKTGAVLINIITFGKTLVLAFLIVGAFAIAKSSGISFAPLLPEAETKVDLISIFFSGLIPVMFCYGGWQNLNFVAEEVRDPIRNMPRAIIIGVVCVIIIYVGANIAYLHVLGAPGLAASQGPAADVARLLIGEKGSQFISVLVVISTFGFLNLALMTAPRVYYAMAANGEFFRIFYRISPRFRVPSAAILLQAGIAVIYLQFKSFSQLQEYAVFADWIFFALAGVAVFVFRRTLPDAPRPFPIPAHPWTTILFMVAGLGIVGNQFYTNCKNACIGAAIIAAGIPVWFAWTSTQKAKLSKERV